MKFNILRVIMAIILLFTIKFQSLSQFTKSQDHQAGISVKKYKYKARHKVKDIPEADFSGNQIKNIILMIGDGMGTSQIYAGMIANRGNLYIEQFPVTGFMKTYSANSQITDSGASATAMSTGKKTNNGMIAMDPYNNSLKTIIEYAEENNLSTGLVVTSAITHATPAAFSAHQFSRFLHEQIALDQVRTDIDILIGGGRDHFTDRLDQVNLLEVFKEKGYLVFETMRELDRSMKSLGNGQKKIAGLIYSDSPPGIMEGRDDMLLKSTQLALQELDRNDKGFFLMIEGSQIDWGNHQKNILYQTEEMLDFDIVIGEVLEYASRNGETLVIVTGDHETGGLAIKDADLKKGIVYGEYTTSGHTGVMVPVFAYGPSAALFSGIYENTDIFFNMMKAFGWKVK